MHTYIKFIRSQVFWDLIKIHPHAYLLLSVIAQRARRSFSDNDIHGLNPGEAFIGDYKNYGMKEHQYRAAKKCLTESGLATFSATNKGTVAKIMNTAIYDINIEDKSECENRQTTGDKTGNQRLTRRKEDEEPKNISTYPLNDNNIQTHKYSTDDMRLATLLSELMTQNNPERKPTRPQQLNKWANSVRLMREQDKRSIDQIEDMIRWSQQDDFWRTVILSMDNLRKNYDKLWLQRKQKTTRNSNTTTEVKSYAGAGKYPIDGSY